MIFFQIMSESTIGFYKILSDFYRKQKISLSCQIKFKDDKIKAFQKIIIITNQSKSHRNTFCHYRYCFILVTNPLTFGFSIRSGKKSCNYLWQQWYVRDKVSFNHQTKPFYQPIGISHLSVTKHPPRHNAQFRNYSRWIQRIHIS